MRNSFFKKYFLLFLIAVLLSACASVKNPPQTANNVDLEKYMGSWYEIASFPNYFQRGCRCTVAHYTLLQNKVKVYNTCRKGDKNKLDGASAIGWAVRDSQNSKLKIQFFWPFTANYWILYVSHDYQNALVGTPNRKYLWILARKPTISQKLYEEMINRARQQGYDTARLIKTQQNC